MTTIQVPLYTSATPIFMAVNEKITGKRAYEQRAYIRAAVRTSLAELGYQGIHIRDLAGACGVSPQTLYNNFGSRDEIVAASIGELVKFQALHAENVSDLTGKNFFLVCCDQLSNLAKTDKNYVQSVFIALKDLPLDHPLIQSIQRELFSTCVYQLTAIKERSCLRPWVDVTELTQLFLNNISDEMIRFYSPHSHSRLTDLNHQLILSIGLPLLGAVSGSEADKIESNLCTSCH